MYVKGKLHTWCDFIVLLIVIVSLWGMSNSRIRLPQTQEATNSQKTQNGMIQPIANHGNILLRTIHNIQEATLHNP